MDESGFRNWLALQSIRPKFVSDMVSRIKKIERATNFDIDKQYAIDGGDKLLSIFNKRGVNSEMDKIARKDLLPVGKDSMATYKSAIKKYFLYKKSLR